MTEYALIYIVQRTLAEIAEFFSHWYIGGYRATSRRLIDFLEQLDHTIAFRITLRYFGTPLFQDRTAVGYILGFFFRTFRLIFGGLLYFFVIVIVLLVYIVWAGIPAYILYRLVAG